MMLLLSVHLLFLSGGGPWSAAAASAAAAPQSADATRSTTGSSASNDRGGRGGGRERSSSGNASDRKCQTLHTSMTYSQDKAPRDISAVLPQIVQKVNEALEGVVDVEVNWEGGEPMHRRVGEHRVEMDVTRLLSAVGDDRVYDLDKVGKDEQGKDVITQCFIFPFQILDTDECKLPTSHAMRHRCAAPAFCVNTVGSYECVCPAGRGGGQQPPMLLSGNAVDDKYFDDLSAQKRDAWSLSLNSASESSCPGSPSTRFCCQNATGALGSGDDCRAAFQCPTDPCGPGGSNDCASSARCVRSDSPLDKPTYQCKCPSGLMGNGRACRKGDVKPRPMVEYDGVTPTAETVRNHFYCGCTKPVVDACAGYPKCEEKHKVCTVTDSNTPICACKPGYVDNNDGWGCVDETPPLLKLRNDPESNGINRLKQGDVYEEHAVDIDDENAEQYQRQLKITYSRPLPPGCLANIGQFHVNYTVATPWTNPPYARVTRTVVVENIDECSINVDKYMTQCPQLIPQCDVAAGAVCADTIGSYTCKCPRYTSGDGFLPIAKLEKDGRGRFIDAPEGYSGGTSCRDTSKPEIQILGPNPKVFRVCKCGGLRGIMGDSKQTDDEDSFEQLRGDQRKRYESDIKEMIKQTAGAELCATHARPNPSPADCVRASDHSFRGTVDLSDRVTVGEPIKKGDTWTVPYNVVDDAGNKAKTVYRTIRVEEIDLSGIERRIRDEILADKQREIDRAVAVAVEKERRRSPTDPRGAQKCSPCPECTCPDKGNGLSHAQCKVICDERIKAEQSTCPNNERPQTLEKDTLHPLVGEVFSFFESFLSASFVLTILLCTFALFVLWLVRCIMNAAFSSRDAYYESYYTKEDEERERAMLRAVSYYRSPGAASAAASSSATPSMPPRATLNGAAVGNGIFSPPENRMFRQRGVFSPQNNGDDGSIYAGMSPITPSRSNGTPVGRGAPASSASPYNLRRRY